MRMATGAAPGKVILFGEHAVVHGQPAVAAALGAGLGATAERDAEGPTLCIPAWGREGKTVRLKADRGAPLDAIGRAFIAALDALGLDRPDVRITVDGALPLGVGLGSSAAFAVAMLRALSDWSSRSLSGEALEAAAEAVEQVFHGTPSGLDHTVVARGGCLRFAPGAPPEVRRVRLACPVPLVVAWSPREGSTREAVEGLRTRSLAQPDLYGALFAHQGSIAEAGVEALEQGDLDRLACLFDLAHGLLNACGVSALVNEHMVSIARANGAMGAKLTGAGRGGAIIALAPGGARDTCADALREAGYSTLVTSISG